MIIALMFVLFVAMNLADELKTTMAEPLQNRQHAQNLTLLPSFPFSLVLTALA